MSASIWNRVVRGVAAVSSASVIFLLSGCGGGGADATFDIGVMIGGQPGGVVIQPGAPQSLSIVAGQSLELDASEPVQWTLMVGGSAVTGSGTTVSYQGVQISVTALTSSRIALDTYAPYSLGATVPITLTAVSTIDSALVASVDVLISN